MSRLRTALAGGLLALPALAFALSGGPARAQTAASHGAGSQCVLRGVVRMPANLPIYDKSSGGDAFARFTGSDTALAASDFPADPKKGRAQIQTGTGTGSFRVAGYTDATRIPVHTDVAIPIVSGHLYIGAKRKVNVIAASTGRLKIQQQLKKPIQQTFTAWASCSTLTLTTSTPPGWSVPGRSRGYVVKQDQVTLYDDWHPGRSEVTALNRAPGGNGILLWSDKRRGAFVHVEYHGAITLNAWARARDLKALPPGETMDELAGPVTKPNPPRLQLQSNPQVVKTTKEVPLRIEAKDDGKVVGLIEKDTETYVIDTVAGWANVLPKALNIAPYGGHQFWVKASDLGL
jgi:hypothetical protein